MSGDCPFCRIFAGSAPAHVLRRGRLTWTFLSLSGHPMVVPVRHHPHLTDLPDATAAELLVEARETAAILLRQAGVVGVNLIQSNGDAAGQEVDHVHLHVLPRRADDGVRLTWPDAPLDNTALARIAEAFLAAAR